MKASSNERDLYTLIHRLESEADGGQKFDTTIKTAKDQVRRIKNGAYVDPLDEKARIINYLNWCNEDGKIAVFTSGMDCDHFSWDNCYHEDFIAPIHWWHRRLDYFDGAEGPVQMSFGRPSISPEYSGSRDLALEAHENGHPYSISTATTEPEAWQEALGG